MEPDDDPAVRDASPGSPSPHLADDHQVVHEGVTMALYIAISLLAVLTALPASFTDAAGVAWTIVGTTSGLAIAHWLAFRVSSLFVGRGRLGPTARRSLVVQALAATMVGVIACLPLLLARGTMGLALSRLLLAGIIGLFAYGVSIQSEPGRLRAVLYAVTVVGIALSVAVVKNVLSGH
jgi:hypothetical protein